MATVSGPAMSFDASGTIGGAVVFSKWKGRNYVRRHAIPSNPKTNAQIAQRAMMRFLSTVWASLTAPDQADWAALAAPDSITPANAFTRTNLDRWTQGQGPKIEPVPSVVSNGTVAQWSASGGVGQASVAVQISPLSGTWAAIIYASMTNGFTPVKTDTRYVRHIPSTTTVSIILPNLAVGTWYFRVAPVSTEGVASLHATQISAVVT